MRQVFVTTVAGAVLGGILAAANSYSPALLPWVAGFMLACLAANILALRRAT